MAKVWIIFDLPTYIDYIKITVFIVSRVSVSYLMTYKCSVKLLCLDFSAVEYVWLILTVDLGAGHLIQVRSMTTDRSRKKTTYLFCFARISRKLLKHIKIV
jgi:hypothetical protein